MNRPGSDEQRLIKETSAIAEIGRIVSSSLDMGPVYQEFALQVQGLIPVDGIQVTVIDTEGAWDEVAFSKGLVGQGNGFDGPTPLQGSITGKVAADRVGLTVQGLSSEELVVRYPCLRASVESGIRSWLAVPIFTHDRVVGALFLYSRAESAFTNQDLELAQRIGNQIAGPIANAKLLADLKNTEARLREAGRLTFIGELANGVAHEINNPLTSVIGYSQLLLDEPLGEEIKKSVEEIHSAGQRAASIVRKLILFAIRDNDLDQYMSVASLLAKAVETVSRELDTGNIVIVTRVAEDLPFIKGDEGQLSQVFIEIITNAAQALMKANREGEIRVAATASAEEIQISIGDNGPGILPENLNRIFEPFFTTNDVGEGSGLGLSISYAIVRNHGGNLWAESVAGQGATFHVTLPYYQDMPGRQSNEFVR